MLNPQYLSTVQAQFAQFAAQSNFSAVFATAFGASFDPLLLENLRQQWLAGDFSVIPNIEVLTGGELGSANGAYAAETDKIYVSSDFLVTASDQAVAFMLVEEIGHRIDTLLNGAVDSAGDEGEIFSLLVNGAFVSAETLAALKVQNDHAVITVGGMSIKVEEEVFEGNDSSESISGNGDFEGDLIFERGGDDTLSGGNILNPADAQDSGNDTIYGGSGDDGISGKDGNDSLFGDSGNDNINGGLGRDTLVGGSGDDFLFVSVFSDDGNDSLLGGDGNDQLYGGRSPDYLSGGNGDDYIHGDAGNDTIYGGNGNDFLVGGYFSDQIDGGAGDDLIYGGFLPSENNDSYAPDQINAGNGNNTVYGAFGDDGIVSGNDSDYIDAGDGNNTVDAGNGNNTVIGGQGIDLITTGSNNDYISAGNGNNIISAGDGSNTIITGSGDDSIVSGTGNDYIDVGAGKDTVDSGDGADLIFGSVLGNDSINSGAGNDAVDGYDGNNTINGGAGDDLINSGSGNDSIIGGNGSDTIASGAGIDYIDSGFDDDSISAGSGDDEVRGGNGNDTIKGGYGYDTVLAGLGDDVVYGDEVEIPTGNIFELTFFPGNYINGQDGNDFIAGGNGDDFIYGESGDDHIEGRAGYDTISGGSGNDVIYGEDGRDDISGGDGNDLIDGGSGDSTLNGDNDNDTIYGGTGVDLIDGGAGGDSIYGADGSDSITGGNENDTITGGAGDDTIRGDSGDDSLMGDFSSETIPGGNDSIDGGNGNDTITGGMGDDVLLGGAGDDSIDGGEGADVIVGGVNGNNTLNGGNGDDYLLGGVDRDILVGGAGIDQMSGKAGDDLYFVDNVGDRVFENFNEGNDTIYSDISYQLGNNLENLTLGFGVDGTGNALDNYIKGNYDNNHLIGAEGNDTLEAIYGKDTLLGGIGNDTYIVNLSGVLIKSGGTEINDESGLDTLVISYPGLVLNLNTDISKSGTSLLVDLNGDKLFNAVDDLKILNFFNTNSIAGKGFIESINNLTSASIIDKFRLPANSVVKETDGNTDLVIINGKYVAVDAITNEMITITYADEIVGVNSFPNWSIVAAEKTSTGDIQYLWKHASGQFWYSTNNNTGKAVSSNDILPYEAIFQQDLNGNGIIYPIVENAGTTKLSVNTSNKYVASNGNVTLDIVYKNRVVGESSYTGWKIVGAEINTTNDNVSVVWKSTAGQYWYSTNTDNGGLVSNIALQETAFQQNFNGDDVIGSNIEAAGTTTLTVKLNGDYRAFYNDTEYEIKYDGSTMGINTVAGWAVIGAEVVGTEVKAVWKSDNSQFWYSTNTDKGGIATDVAKYEFEFQQDFNQDGFISQVGTVGDDTLGGSSTNELLTGGAGIDTFVLKATNNGIDKITDFAADEFLNVSDFGLGAFNSSNLQIFTGTGTPSGTSVQQFILDSSNGDLYFDYIGGFAVKLATLQGVTNLTIANFKV
jgi:Ca2+-binding RTX toxin-like protein